MSARPVIAVVAVGDMGRGIAARLTQGGARVITNLQGRGEGTRERAASAGVEAVADDDALVREAQIVLSIVPPGAAIELAERMAAAVQRTGATPAYVDCNAIAAVTMRRVGEIIAAVGAQVGDVGIIGGPPDKSPHTKLYASGPHAAAFEQLGALGLDVRVIGDELGAASALKMGYGGFTKGLQALAVALMVSARRAGVAGPLEEALTDTQGALLALIDRALPGMPPKAYRWVAEMQEGALSLTEAGLPPDFFEGAAAIYAAVAETDVARETPIGGKVQASRAMLMDRLAEEIGKTKA